jgi:hypothetical protein
MALINFLIGGQKDKKMMDVNKHNNNTTTTNKQRTNKPEFCNATIGLLP